MGGPVRQVTTRVAAQELNVLIREKAGPEAQDAGPGGQFSTDPPLAARASRAGSLPPEECGERLVSGAHGEDFMTADGAVASPGDPRQRCEPPAALAAALVSTPAQNK